MDEPKEKRVPLRVLIKAMAIALVAAKKAYEDEGIEIPPTTPSTPTSSNGGAPAAPRDPRLH